ncbi:hypothetical protein B0H14DRAFT_2685527, partial [Mycena olivaceomarginata]
DIDTMARETAQSHLSFEFSQIQSSLADIQAALGPIQPATAAPIQAAVAQIAAALGRLSGSLQASLNQIGPLQASISQIQADLTLQPMRIANASPCWNAPLKGPQLQTLDELYFSETFLEENCMASASALGLPALLPDATLHQRRQQIGDYLGVTRVAAPPAVLEE